MSKEVVTIWDILPDFSKDGTVLPPLIQDATQFLSGDFGERVPLPDEVVFVALLEKYIEYFERAKRMVANRRFTVRYRGEAKAVPDLFEFQIIPIDPETKGEKESSPSG